MGEKNPYFSGIKPQSRRELFDVCGMYKNITWNWMEVKNCKLRLWFPSNKIYIEYIILLLGTFYHLGLILDFFPWIDTFYNLLFPNVWTKSNHKIIELSDSTNAYTYSFYSFIGILIIKFYNERKKIKQSRSTMV